MWATVPLLAVAACGLVPTAAAVPEPPSVNHLWFRSFISEKIYSPSCGGGPCLIGLICGEIDAGPRMPDDIFGRFAEYDYGAATVELYRVRVETETPCSNGKSCPLGGFCDEPGNCAEEVRVELGRCADKNYTVPLHNESNVPWAPVAMMDEVCQSECKCNYLNKNKTVPGLPECPDKADGPWAINQTSGFFCSLCGPKYNQPVEIAMFGCSLGKYECAGPEDRPPEGSNTKGSVGLVPLPHCTKLGRNVCYQGTAAEVAQVVKLDPFACKPPSDAHLVTSKPTPTHQPGSQPYQHTNPCYDSGFGELLGHDPIFPKVQLWGCGDTCGPNPENYTECAVLQGRTQGTGMYCIGPPKRFSDGTLRNHSIVTCHLDYRNPGGLASGFLGVCPSGEYCGKGTGEPANASQCFPV